MNLLAAAPHEMVIIKPDIRASRRDCLLYNLAQDHAWLIAPPDGQPFPDNHMVAPIGEDFIMIADSYAALTAQFQDHIRRGGWTILLPQRGDLAGGLSTLTLLVAGGMLPLLTSGLAVETIGAWVTRLGGPALADWLTREMLHAPDLLAPETLQTLASALGTASVEIPAIGAAVMQLLENTAGLLQGNSVQQDLLFTGIWTDLRRRENLAEALQQRLIALVETADPRLSQVVALDTLHIQARQAVEKGCLLDAEPLLEQALAIAEMTLGANHLETAMSLLLLGIAYEQQGKDDKARPLLDRAVAVIQMALGDADPATTENLKDLISLYGVQALFY